MHTPATIQRHLDLCYGVTANPADTRYLDPQVEWLTEEEYAAVKAKLIAEMDEMINAELYATHPTAFFHEDEAIVGIFGLE